MKISVIVPMFNAENFIEECIDSILSQTFRDFELILVDDCSTDRTVDLIRERFDDPRIRIIPSVRKGYDWGARNLGIQFARGNYVYFVDHDDLLLPDALERLWQGVEISQADTIHFNAYIADSNPVGSRRTDAPRHRVEETTAPWQFIPENLEYRLFHRETTLQVMPWQKLIRRNFLIEHGIYFPSVWFSSDSLVFFAELCLARKIFIIDGCGYVYRSNLESQMHSDFEKAYKLSIENFAPLIDYMEEIFSKDLVTPLSRDLQLRYEMKFFRMLNLYLAKKAYDSGNSLETIESILHEKIREGFLRDSKSIRMLFHLGVENYLMNKNKSKG